MVVRIPIGRRKPAWSTQPKEGASMFFTCNLVIHYLPGQVPGQLSAVLNWVTPEGTVIATQAVSEPIAVGRSLTIGPVNVLVQMNSEVVMTTQSKVPLGGTQGTGPLAAMKK